MRIRHALLGTSLGNFNRRHAATTAAYAALLRRACNQLEPPLVLPSGELLMPVTEFTNRVVTPGEDDASWGHGVTGTAHPADGAVTQDSNIAVALTNADCPIITLSGGGRLAALHGGFRCLIREESDDPNIIEIALQRFPRPADVSAWIGYGIGPCCWRPGYDTKPEILGAARSRHANLLAASLAQTTAASPFGPNQVSVDLYTLARGLLRAVGIPDDHIATDARCTCCATDAHGAHSYWSHTRFRKEGGTDGCNVSVFWLEPGDDRE